MLARCELSLHVQELFHLLVTEPLSSQRCLIELCGTTGVGTSPQVSVHSTSCHRSSGRSTNAAPASCSHSGVARNDIQLSAGLVQQHHVMGMESAAGAMDFNVGVRWTVNTWDRVGPIALTATSTEHRVSSTTTQAAPSESSQYAHSRVYLGPYCWTCCIVRRSRDVKAEGHRNDVRERTSIGPICHFYKWGMWHEGASPSGTLKTRPQLGC